MSSLPVRRCNRLPNRRFNLSVLRLHPPRSELFESSMNVVVAAPTGSGKTVLMELAILQLLANNLDPATGQSGPR